MNKDNNNFFNNVLQQLRDDLQQLRDDYNKFEQNRLNSAVVQLVTLLAQEIKKRTDLENSIRDIIRPEFDMEKAEMPEDLLEAVKCALDKRYVMCSISTEASNNTSEIVKIVKETLNKCVKEISGKGI